MLTCRGFVLSLVVCMGRKRRDTNRSDKIAFSGHDGGGFAMGCTPGTFGSRKEKRELVRSSRKHGAYREYNPICILFVVVGALLLLFALRIELGKILQGAEAQQFLNPDQQLQDLLPDLTSAERAVSAEIGNSTYTL